jgi:elongation factor Ts
VATKLKENIAVRRFERFELSGDGLVTGYIHHNGKVAALIELSAPAAAAGSEELAGLASKILFQIVAQSPRFVDRTAVPEADAARERELHADIVRKEGKPEAAVPKIVEGKMNKLFYQVFCLVDQVSVVENKLTIKDLLAAASAKVGGPVSIRRFARYQVGEG